MTDLLGLTHDLNLALQKRDQDLLNALNLVKRSKDQMQRMRDSEWEALLEKVVTVCCKFDVDVPDMTGCYYKSKRSTRQPSFVTNLHHYKSDCFFKYNRSTVEGA